MTQHRHLEAMQLPPVIPAVHVKYIHADPGTVQAFEFLQHEFTEMAALAAVDGQLDQGSVADFADQWITIGSLQRPGDHFDRAHRNLADSSHQPGAGHGRVGIRSTDM